MVERIEVTVNGTVYAVEIDNLSNVNGTPIEVRVNGRPYTVRFGKAPEAEVPVQQPEEAPVPEPRPQPTASRPVPAVRSSDGQGQQVSAPMPGKILSVAVEVGQHVREKEALCTLEAMKMEMSIAAPVSGTVREVRAKVGENVVYGDLLFVIG
jgi:biotin carboxyl carrier protein